MGQDCSCFKGATKDAATRTIKPAATEARSQPAYLELEESEGEQGVVRVQAPLGPDGLPSIGSAGHETGDCKRCAFFPKDRCQNGHDCKFCHFEHEAGKRTKKKRGSGSTRSTPLSDMVGSLGAAGLTPSPLGAAGMLVMPGSPPPQGPPPAADHLPMAQVPPAPAAAPNVSLAQVGEAAQPPVAPVSLDDLFRMSAAPTASSAASAPPAAGASAGASAGAADSGAAAPGGQDQAPLMYWPQQHQQYYTGEALGADWSAYANAATYEEYYAAAYAAALAEAQQAYGVMPIYDQQASGKDSPRSVLLTLCGAWGALKGPGNEEPAGPSHSRDTLLAYRQAALSSSEGAKSAEAGTVLMSARKLNRNGGSRRAGKTG